MTASFSINLYISISSRARRFLFRISACEGGKHQTSCQKVPRVARAAPLILEPSFAHLTSFPILYLSRSIHQFIANVAFRIDLPVCSNTAFPLLFFQLAKLILFFRCSFCIRLILSVPRLDFGLITLGSVFTKIHLEIEGSKINFPDLSRLVVPLKATFYC
jgi:hypothetical protein